MGRKPNRGYQKIRDLEMAHRRRVGERADDDAKCAFPCALEELQRRAQCGRAMAKWLDSWGKSSSEETHPLFLGSRTPERAFTRTKSEKQGLKEAESSSRGGGGGVSSEPQYQQSLYNSSWRGGDSSSSPRERKEVLAAGLMSESLMNLEAAAGVGAGAAGVVAGGGRVMMTMMMMAQQHQQQQQQQPQQTRSTFWQALGRTTSSNQINLFLSLDQAVVCTDVRGNITSW